MDSVRGFRNGSGAESSVPMKSSTAARHRQEHRRRQLQWRMLGWGTHPSALSFWATWLTFLTPGAPRTRWGLIALPPPEPTVTPASPFCPHKGLVLRPHAREHPRGPHHGSPQPLPLPGHRLCLQLQGVLGTLPLPARLAHEPASQVRSLVRGEDESRSGGRWGGAGLTRRVEPTGCPLRPVPRVPPRPPGRPGPPPPHWRVFGRN